MRVRSKSDKHSKRRVYRKIENRLKRDARTLGPFEN